MAERWYRHWSPAGSFITAVAGIFDRVTEGKTAGLSSGRYQISQPDIRTV